MSFHVDEKEGILYSGDYDGVAKKWNLTDLSLVTSWRAHPEGAPVYALAGNQNWLFSSSCDGEVKQWLKSNCEFVQMTIVVVRNTSLKTTDHLAPLN